MEHLIFEWSSLTTGHSRRSSLVLISPATWQDWLEGIRSNLRMPAFEAAWKDFKSKSGESLGELRHLEREGFTSDPARENEVWSVAYVVVGGITVMTIAGIGRGLSVAGRPGRSDVPLPPYGADRARAKAPR